MNRWSWKNFKYAFDGLQYAFQTQNNFRIQLIIGCIVVAAGFWLSINTLEWILIILCIGLVLTLEVLNTALEEIVNFISPDFHPLAGKIKDLSAAAVLIIAIIAAIIGMVIFLPKMINLL